MSVGALAKLLKEGVAQTRLLELHLALEVILKTML